MSRLRQILTRYKRVKKERRCKTPALMSNPQLKGVCVKVFTRTPKNQILQLEKLQSYV